MKCQLVGTTDLFQHDSHPWRSERSQPLVGQIGEQIERIWCAGGYATKLYGGTKTVVIGPKSDCQIFFSSLDQIVAFRNATAASFESFQKGNGNADSRVGR
ncbi:MAG TPA: hypothetical protein VFU48_15820 [Nitrospira sp.]|nr:hypothetical protein [Nitrospira sp.]